ncbi:hypothetical protein TRFO_27334 [Tritrichomonas foetus]|uniref:Integral membrane protein n=1 Tax=Tritrichomonas foetus TaxID=1144522 RepID=A0A1J4K5R6_9EUKA|nr:hypothetical protein TRFO_27334 [Tritrichomonas foetus]|eukprot:OHT05022.1 hypothetical protein TRFO_27334 [Tritrichomonas foetus]
MYASNLTCRYAMTGLGCNVPEMFTLGIFFLGGFLACVYFLFHHYSLKRRSNRRSRIDFSVIFFSTMAIWMLFRGVISIFPFDYTIFSVNIVFTNVSAILFMLPLSFVILILCNILFAYRNPGTKMIIFFKMLFFIFQSAFLLIAVVVSIADAQDNKELVKTMKLWHSCTDFLICMFFAVPAVQLIKAIAVMSIVDKDRKCLGFSTAGIAVFCFIFILRVIYNILGYLDVNPIEHFLDQEIGKAERLPSAAARAFTVIYYLFFDFFAGCLGIAAVVLIEKKDLNIVTDPNYGKQMSDSGVID